MATWNTREFFDKCLSDFSEFPPINVHIAEDGSGANERYLLFMLAQIGFSKYTDRKNWSREAEEYIARFVDSDLTPGSMTRFEETADAVAAFACFVYGALAGKYTAGELDHSQFELGVLHLPGFYFGHMEEIHKAYIEGIGAPE